MVSTEAGSADAQSGSGSVFSVLNVGSGVQSSHRLHAAFRGSDWREVRLDIDHAVAPDIVGDIVDLRGKISSGLFDAVWSSHNLEHLNAHEVAPAVAEIHRVLNASGFVLITCPDLAAIGKLISEGRVEEAAYVSPAGPITPLDMLFGHGRSIAGGNTFMRHRTGFTTKSLGNVLVAGGFAEVWVRQGSSFDIWAVGLKSHSDRHRVLQIMANGGLDFSR